MPDPSPTPAARRPRPRAFVLGGALGGALVGTVGLTAGACAPAHDSGHARHRPAGSAVVSAYFLGDSPTGLRLYDEPHTVAGEGEGEVLAALREITAGQGPDDPDYRTVWPAGSFRSVRRVGDRVVVALGSVAVARPDGVTAAEAALGVQQAVHTVDAVVGATTPVGFAGGDPLGSAVDGPVAPDRSFALLAPVTLGDLAEGAEAHGSLAAGGTAGGEVTTVRWRLTGNDDPHGTPDRSGTSQVRDGTWSTGPIDLDGLPPGAYVLTAATNATGQTSAVAGTYDDDRDITIR